MDNITHTLAGTLLGEVAWRGLRSANSNLDEPVRRGLFLAIGIIGSNLPDIDFVYPLITQNKLDYLSQHRGYTHTLLGAVFGAVLLVALVEVWCRWRRMRPSSSDRVGFAAMALGALAAHVAMDFTNNYGVHPLWPFYNGWVYGDSVFIVEPALWVAAAPLLFVMRSRIARGLIALVLIGAMVLTFASGWVPASNAIALATLLAILLVAGYTSKPAHAVIAAAATWLAITGIFVASSRVAAREVMRESAAMYHEEALLDHVLTPMPANPLCWDVIAVFSQGEYYGLRRGVLSLAPSVFAPVDCGDKALEGPRTAVLNPVPQQHRSGSIRWQDEWQTKRSRLVALVSKDCKAQILMRFARAPFIRETSELVLGDLRFDREKGIGFAEVELNDPPSSCPSHVPPWIPPREELLDGG